MLEDMYSDMFLTEGHVRNALYTERTSDDCVCHRVAEYINNPETCNYEVCSRTNRKLYCS